MGDPSGEDTRVRLRVESLLWVELSFCWRLWPEAPPAINAPAQTAPAQASASITRLYPVIGRRLKARNPPP